VSAETTGETYLEYLPAFYRRDEPTRHLLGCWLSLFQSEFGDLELKLKEMSRRFDPAVAPEEFLPWLAGWMAFEPPPGRSAQELRRLLPRIHDIYNRRGTLAGLGHLIELYTGVRPRISEAFMERKIWQLDHSSRLGEDTFLPSASPNGIVVPERTAASPVGEMLVGESSPLAPEEYGWPLFSETAHRFTVYLPAAEVPDAAQRNAIRRIIEAEMPAHAEYHLCFFEDEPEEENIADDATGNRLHAASEQTLEAPSEQPTETSMLVVEAVEFRDVNNRIVALLEDPRQSPQFGVSRQINSIVVRFNDDIDPDTVTIDGDSREQAASGFHVQASWSRRADKSCPGSILLDGEVPRTVRFNIATPSGYFRTGRYTVTMYGDEDASTSRPAIKSTGGRRLNGAAWQTAMTAAGAPEGGSFVFNFQITA
jgi:phage tail-like protein